MLLLKAGLIGGSAAAMMAAAGSCVVRQSRANDLQSYTVAGKPFDVMIGRFREMFLDSPAWNDLEPSNCGFLIGPLLNHIRPISDDQVWLLMMAVQSKSQANTEGSAFILR